MVAFMVDFGINIHISWSILELHPYSSLGFCVPVLTEGPKGLWKCPLIPQGPLRTVSEADTGHPNTTGPFLTRPFGLQIKFGDLKTIFH